MLQPIIVSVPRPSVLPAHFDVRSPHVGKGVLLQRSGATPEHNPRWRWRAADTGSLGGWGHNTRRRVAYAGTLDG